MRSVGSELVSVLTVMAVPAAIALVFPYSALGFRAVAPKRPPEVTAALVRLSAEGERSAVQSAKNSWRGEDGNVRHLRAEMSFGELPEPPRTSVLSVEERSRRPVPPVATGGIPPYLPSLEAAPPETIGAEKAAPELPFAKEEFLRID